jgi:hypothetical protein
MHGGRKCGCDALKKFGLVVANPWLIITPYEKCRSRYPSIGGGIAGSRTSSQGEGAAAGHASRT